MASRRDSKAALAAVAISPLGVISPPPIEIRAPNFEGSLGMLFACVRDRKIELLDVPLAPICAAYFEYLIEQPDANLDEAAAALVALAYLLERKAWLLLPSPEPGPEELDALEPIASSIAEYGSVIEVLRVWQAERERHFFRSPGSGPNAYELPYVLEDVSTGDLAVAFERLLETASPSKVDPPDADERPLSEVIRAVLLAVSDRWRPLSQLLPPTYSRLDAVYWFLAILELIRLGQVTVRVRDDDVEFAGARHDRRVAVAGA